MCFNLIVCYLVWCIYFWILLIGCMLKIHLQHARTSVALCWVHNVIHALHTCAAMKKACGLVKIVRVLTFHFMMGLGFDTFVVAKRMSIYTLCL